MPSNGDKLPTLYNSNNTLPRLGQDSIANRSSPFPQHRSSSNIPTEGQRNIKARIGHRRIDVSKRPLGSKPSHSNNSVRSSSLSRSMEGNDSRRNWDSEGGRPKSPQRQPVPNQTKKSGFKRLLQRPSFDGLMPFQRAPRDGSYEKSLPSPRNHTLDAPVKTLKDKNNDKNMQPDKIKPRRFKTSASLSQDNKLSGGTASRFGKSSVPGKKENSTRQSSPTLTRLLRRRRSHDRNSSHQEISNQNPSRSSTDSPPMPVPLSHQTTTVEGPNEVNSRQVPLESHSVPQRNESVAGLLNIDLESLPNSPPEVPPRDNFSSARIPSRSGTALIDLSPREDLSSTTNPRHSLNNDNNSTSSRDLYSTFFGSSRRHSNPVPPPRTSASLSPRDIPASPREPQRQPNSVFRHQPILRTTTESPRPRDLPPRPRANSEQTRTRTSSPRFRNLLSRRGSSSSNSSRENSQSIDNTNRENEREGSSSRSFWRNSFFGRLGSAERRSRNRSDSAASSASNTSQDNTSSTQQSATTADTNDADFPGFPFRQRGMRYSGLGLNRNDSTSSGDLPNGPRIIRLTLGQSGADIGSLLSGTRGQDGSPISAGDLGIGDDELGMQIALIGSPSLMSPAMDLATVPPRLLLSFLLQGRRELGNEFVELVLENLLLSILARHMMEVGGQGGGGGAHPPATQDMIDKLEGFIVEQEHIEEDLNCAICHVEYELSEKLSKLPCAHFFHPTCISIWLKKSATCPVCRFKLPRPNETPAGATA